jgi:predicted PurR-regulated permease PerM
MNTTIRFSTAQLFKIPLVGLVVYGFWQLRGFLLLLVLALIISTFIEDFVQRGKKYHIKRIISVLAFYIIGSVLVVGTLFFILPIFGKEFLSLLEYSPLLAHTINDGTIIDKVRELSSFANVVDLIRGLSLDLGTFKPLLSIFGGVFNVFIVFLVSFYLSVHDGMFEKLLLLVSPREYHKKTIDVWHRTQKKIGSWFRGQLIIALILVVLTYIGLSVLGIPYAFLLSLLAGLFGLVPYGIFLALIPAMSLGFTHNVWYSGFLVLGMYMIIQQILDYVLQPIILKKMTGIPSLLVILSVIIGAILFGLIGVLIAVPVALFIIELVAEVQKKKGIEIIEVTTGDELRDQS